MVLHSDLATDVSTASNFRDVKVEKFHLNIKVDFDKRCIVSRADLDVIVVKPTDKVTLDVHQTLTVHKVVKEDVGGGNAEQLEFEIKPFADYGTALEIKIPETYEAGKKFVLKIDYVSTGGPGVCWLDPAQTAGKVKPYMYTQGQASCNRSFFPCQDTPAVKCPYSATVRVPKGFTAVMSASESRKEATAEDDHETFFFSLQQPVQSYLVALAVGDLASAEIGPRSRVWTEPSMLEKAKNEFDGEVEIFLSKGEELFGPYQWGRYDLLVMPPSFPFGGMENPCLTFVTPCLLVGDKSLTDVVIHEISHSWFGNLVTNANWGEFWLNEGFTMFAQRRIMEELPGLGKAYTCLEATTGLALLRQHMDDTGEDHPLNKLRVVIEPGVDPDDTYNETPYEKGYTFVCYLQQLAGGVKEFDDFLKKYVEKFKFKSIVAEDTLDFFLECFPKLKEQQVDKKPGFEFKETWLEKAGWPPYVPDLSAGRALTTPAEELANYWAGEIQECSDKDPSRWKTYQVFHFLDKILEKSKLPENTLKKMAETYPFIANTHNAEVRLRWSQITLKHDCQEDFPNIRQFLHSQGKQKYVLPIYRAMMKGSETAKKMAHNVFEETASQLHINVRNYVKKILNIN